jgi:hypothetical protein
VTESKARSGRPIVSLALFSIAALINLPLWLGKWGTFWGVAYVVWTVAVLVLLGIEIVRYLRAKRLEGRH